MGTFYIIISVLAILLMAAIAFFLMCIWRAIFGKSTIDIKLNTNIGFLAKKLDTFDKNVTKNVASQEGLSRDIKGLTRAIQSLSNEKDDRGTY